MVNPLKKDVVITDGARQYFRPSIYKMEREVKYEVPDYTSGLFPNDDGEDLTLINQSYDRLCHVRTRMKDLNCMEKENVVDIMVLLGVEHKLSEQIKDVEGFITHYDATIANINKQLKGMRYKIHRLFTCGKTSNHAIPLMFNKQHQEQKLEKFKKEHDELKSLSHYIQGKILFLSDTNIAKLGIIKD